MGKKKGKKEKKVKGAEKTAMKTEKKAEKKLKKLLQKKGEKDIEAMIAELANQKRPLKEEKCPPPSPRCNMSLTAHPDKDELFMFGGEFFSGNNTTVYDDFLTYHIKTNEWTRQTLPVMPPPRCSHQVVAVRQGGGQLWLFGGEFSSPSQSQFYHYNDLWVYHIKDKTWTKIDSPGAPSPRSGHRMVQVKKLLIIFGGFRDNARDYHYFNDVHAFNLETYAWVKLDIQGTPPSPRSGFVMAPCTDPPLINIYGGYCKEKVKRDSVMGRTHADMFALMPENKQESTPLSWKWVSLKQSGYRPSPRCACSVVTTVGNRAIIFGGVYDHQDEDDEDSDINGTFFNEMFSLEVERGKWHEMLIQDKKQSTEKKRRRRKEKGTKEEGDTDDEMMEEVESLCVAETSSVFNVQPGSSENFTPSARMNPAMTIRNGVLYLYGGVIEEGEKQFTMSDFYSLDLHKLDKWQVLIADESNSKIWVESDSSDDEDVAMEGDEDSESSSSSSSDEDDEMDISDNAPSISAGESLDEYFERSKESWVAKAEAVAQKEGLNVKPKQMVKAARNMAAEFYQQHQ
ncbi:hypothetical protein CAPTEDRAFT_226649 [Capitella teleta]|uniref:DUF4110 domain-containing protein n=1 Tax=Capitella teleta TaxID=283909 RepID=R7VGF7_CAPTE|nr:hypothetical protein CAPTEDRAFT_226649 [Capitella teleta]|eukprot:ELU14765.1 hypothetical protein CAPTEDRAFT_226649 [Capitella teleta]